VTGVRGVGAGRRGRVASTALAGAVLAALAACAPAAPPAVAAVPPAPVPAASVRVLQLNLCNSGIAACFTGRSTARAAAVIAAERPDVVTLNEVCDDDVPVLERALAAAVPGAATTAAFQPARDRTDGRPYPCRNGHEYGIGVVAARPAAPGPVDAGIYPDQDPADPEERAWLCVALAGPSPLGVCTTHLASTVRAVAAAQCRHLFTVVVPRLGPAPVVLGADLNLGPGRGPELAACLPPGAALVDDGGEQHVVATPGFAVGERRTVDLAGTTDHPGLLVTLDPR
jgi:endonuclease/exonuclease/phosphatase family metal-dependent hydrolase